MTTEKKYVDAFKRFDLSQKKKKEKKKPPCIGVNNILKDKPRLFLSQMICDNCVPSIKEND